MVAMQSLSSKASSLDLGLFRGGSEGGFLVSRVGILPAFKSKGDRQKGSSLELGLILFCFLDSFVSLGMTKLGIVETFIDWAKKE